MKSIVNTWTGKSYAVTEQQRNFFQRVILLTIQQLEAEINQHLAWLRGEERHPFCTRAQEAQAKNRWDERDFLPFFPRYGRGLYRPRFP